MLGPSTSGRFAASDTTPRIRGCLFPAEETERATTAAVQGVAGHVRVTGHDLATRFGLAPVAEGEGSARSGAVGTAPPSRGIEPPREIAETIGLVDRAFAFVDLCGFTRFIATDGEHAAIDTLSRFRSLARHIATDEVELVAKWPGDGAMIARGRGRADGGTAHELIGRSTDRRRRRGGRPRSGR